MADGPPRAARMARRHSINIADDFERGRPIVDDDLPLAPPQFKRTPKKSFGGGSSALAGLPGAMGALNKSFNTSSPEAAKDGPQALRSPRSSGVRVTLPDPSAAPEVISDRGSQSSAASQAVTAREEARDPAPPPQRASSYGDVATVAAAAADDDDSPTTGARKVATPATVPAGTSPITGARVGDTSGSPSTSVGARSILSGARTSGGSPSSPQIFAKQVDSLHLLYKKYTVEKTIGRGHFAKVKQVLNKLDGTRYAVKLLDKAMCDHDLQDLVNEFEVLKRLRHPNIIRIVDAYESPTHLCLVTELATGGELMHRISQENSTYSEGEMRRHCLAVISAVDYMHSKSIVHRDIKPENVLLSDRSEAAAVKLCDMGLARHFQTRQLLRTICGTHKYLAPELVRCGRGEVSGYDQAVDIWGVGLLMYIMLFGVNPFDRADTIASNNAILAGRYTFPAASAVSIEAKDLISRILRTSPEQRPSAAECLRHEWLASATLDSGIDALMHETQQALAQYNARREKERGRKSTGLRALDIGQLQRHQLPPAVASGRPAAPPPPARPAPPTWGSGTFGSGSLAAAAPLSPRGSGSGSGASGSNGELTPRSAVALRGRNLVFGSQ